MFEKTCRFESCQEYNMPGVMSRMEFLISFLSIRGNPDPGYQLKITNMYNDPLKKEPTAVSTLLYAIKNRKLKKWFYEFKHGHPFLLSEEADIIVETRLNDRMYKFMNDYEIQKIVKIRVKAMYKNKFPKAKQWSLPIFNRI